MHRLNSTSLTNMASLSKSTETDEVSCYNSFTEHSSKDDCSDGHHTQRRQLFRIDTSKIESVPHFRQHSELQDLDLHVYDQDTFEQGHLTFLLSFSCLSRTQGFELH